MKMREEEKNQSSQWKNFFKKRWVFPAVYLVSAALLITLIVWYQGSLDKTTETPEVAENTNDKAGIDEPVIEVNQSFENIEMPVSDEDSVSIVTEFFDSNASADQQEAALIVDGNKYRPSMGIDISQNDGQEFDVTASLSGKVIDVRQDAFLGNVIEVDHGEGIVTVYQSVKDIKVKAGDAVGQGDVLAKSSVSELNKTAKNHVHFEIRKDNNALNPHTYFGQPLTVLAELDEQSDVSATEESEVTEESMDDAESEETDQNPSLEIEAE
ncbi:M23 family metallopeptidase [Pseudogracilibacillus auburnensis]|uniref:M23 family metallopeptidase n=1 Tax=Pseudogracilibacillus auburnensis TaxID=1494959 RepID=UPI001F615761|nr:M23 family metallopeptidase [Pseudogracilibacillus auburnensis]